MIKNSKLFKILYHFCFALSASVVGALLASYPLIFVFTLVQKSNETVNLSIFQVMHNYNQLMFYLLWPFKQNLHMDNFHTSQNAFEHFRDCKQLFLIATAVFIFCLVICFYAKKNLPKNFLKIDKIWALIFLILPMAILPFAIANFDSFFVVFHHLLFRNSNWLFDPSVDPIINILTEGFFASCFAVSGIIYELYFASLLLK